MKKLILLFLCIITCVITSSAQIKYRGEKGVSSAGVLAGYAIDNKALTLGVDFRFNILNQLRLSPSVLYALENDNRSTLYFNFDAHYLLRATNRITVYPIAGVGLSAWKEVLYVSPKEPTGIVSKSNTTNVRAGLNLGVGAEKRMTRDIIVGVEFKYNLTTERIYDQAMLLGRVAYYF